MSTSTRTIFPDCMMPDGAEPCRGFQQMQEFASTWHRSLEAIATILGVNPCSDCATLTREIAEAIRALQRGQSEPKAELAPDFDRAATLVNDGHGYTIWRIGGRQFVPLDEADEAVRRARQSSI